MAMRERGTETIEPYEPPEEPAYEWEYDEEPAYRRAPRILWGRLAVLGAFLIVAFLIGRATAGGGVSQDDFDEAKAQRDDARAQVTQLQSDVSDFERQNMALQEDNEQLEQQLAGTDTGEAPAEAPAETPAGETYTVRSGDTLLSIAEQFYGDTTLADYIAEANDIVDASDIQAGQTLTIPPEPPEE